MADEEVTIVLRGKNLSTPQFEEARRQLAGFKDSVKDTSGQVSGLGGIVKTAVGTMTGFISAQAILGAVSGAFSFAKSAAIDMNASLEKSTLQFATLMGDTARAEQHVRSLFNFAKSTPFETGPVIEASRHMQTFGGDALNTMDNLRLLGDASAATSAPIEDLGFWVGRMYASLQGGQPIGEATMRLMELGVLTPQTRVQMEALAASAGGGEKAFSLFQASLGKFSGAMVTQANTWDGLMSSISDAINITLADALKPFFDAVKEGAQIVLHALGSEGMSGAAEGLKRTLAAVFSRDNLLGFLDGLLGLGSVALTTFDVVNRAANSLGVVFSTVFSGVLRGVQAMVDGLRAVTNAASYVDPSGGFERTTEALDRASQSLVGLRGRFEEVQSSTLETVRGQGVFTRVVVDGKAAIEAMRAELGRTTVATNDQTQATVRARPAQEKSVVLTKEQTKALKEAAEAAKAFAASVDFFGTRLDAFNHNALQPYAAGLSDAAAKADIFEATQPVLASSATVAARAIEEAWRATGKYVQMTGTAVNQTGLLSGVFNNLGQNILGAFQGGGNVVKSIGSDIGSRLGANLVKNFGTKITGVLGETFGGALNAALPGIGTLLGPLMEKVWGGLKSLFGGISPEIKRARQDVEAFQQALAQTLTTTQQQEAGGERWKMSVIAVRDAYLATGRTASEAEAIVRQLWDTDHPDRAKAAIEQINLVLGEQQGILQGNRDELARLTDEMEGLKRDGEITWEKMRDAAGRYGVRLSELGTDFQNGRLHESFQTIWDDFVLLTKGGASVGGVLFDMKDEIIALARESVEFGTTIPANFRPLLQNLEEGGHLIDENGQKLLDLSQVQFGDPIVAKLDAMTERLGVVADRITALTELLASRLPASADAAARSLEDTSRRGITAMEDLGRAISDEVIEMHSPTGLEGIVHYAGRAREAVIRMAGDSIIHVRQFADEIGRIPLVMRQVSEGRLLPAGGGLLMSTPPVPLERGITETMWQWAPGHEIPELTKGLAESITLAHPSSLAIAPSGAPVPAVNVFVSVDRSGETRPLTEAEFYALQQRGLTTGRITVPSRAITER
jgi:hypothetical protein